MADEISTGGGEEVVVDGGAIETPETQEEVIEVNPEQLEETTEPEPEEEKQEDPIPEEEPEKKEEPKEFDPDELEFEEEEKKEDENPYNIDGYNLEAYKDIFDFETPESRQYIEEEVAKLKEKGYTQEKLEGYVDALLQSFNNTQEQDTAETVKAELNESLSKEEKANYKAIGNWLKDNIKGSEFEGDKYKSIMSNPQLVKLMNTLYKQSISKTGVKTVDIAKPVPKVQMNYKTAMESLADQNLSGDEFKAYAKDLTSKMKGEDLAQFKESVYSLFKLEV